MYWWRILNDAVFEGTLNTPYNIRICKFNGPNGYLGACWGWGFSKKRPVTIQMKEEFDDKELFMAVLVHEMVHQWQQQTHGRMTHGKTFLKWKKKIKEIGLPLSVTY